VALEPLTRAESHIVHAVSHLIRSLSWLEDEDRKAVIDAIAALNTAQEHIKVIKKRMVEKFKAVYRV